jgi:hypothetical protein
VLPAGGPGAGQVASITCCYRRRGCPKRQPRVLFAAVHHPLAIRDLGQVESNGRPGTRLTLGNDRSAMRSHQAAGDGQPQSAPGRVGGFEGAIEHPAKVLVGDACAAIAHGQVYPARIGRLDVVAPRSSPADRAIRHARRPVARDEARTPGESDRDQATTPPAPAPAWPLRGTRKRQ